MPVKKVGIIGYGVLGRQLEQFISAMPDTDGIEWLRFDDTLVAQGVPDAVKFADHADDRFANCDFYVGLGYRHLATKEAIIASLVQRGRSVPALIHATAYVDPTAVVGPGVVIFPNCTIGSGVTLSAGVVLHCAVTLAHDDLIGRATYVGPGVTISGFATVGARSFVGTGTKIADGVTVGDDVTIGIGTCVTSNVESKSSVIGNPMRVLERPLELK